jgi:catechol 2,3-dioxygenase-like lactoylglutathione lyase family enzyme
MSLADARPIAFVQTADRKAAEAFYRDTLGLRQLDGDGFAAVFDLAGTPMRLTEVPGFQPAMHPVLGWDVPDIAAAVRALTANGVTMNIYDGLGQDADGIWAAPDGSCKVVFFNDPDGNALSLTQRL